MIPLLLFLGVTTPTPITIEPHEPIHLCDAVLYELYQGVEFNIITADQADRVYIRCLVNYS